jgi:excisionase family DNA binding protein
MTNSKDDSASSSNYQKVSDVARELNVSTQHVRNLVRGGEIAPTIKPGRQYLIPQASLDDFLRRVVVRPDELYEDFLPDGARRRSR